MTDREKVIRLIEEEISVCESLNQGYRTINLQDLRDILAVLKEQEEQIKNRDESLVKALEEIKWLLGMLKKQEPMKPHRSGPHTFCARCGTAFNKNSTDFCPHCGQAVKRNG